MDVQFWKELMQTTREIDARWVNQEAPQEMELHFPVPLSHPRHQQIQSYTYKLGSIEKLTPQEGDLVVVDKKVLKEVEPYLTGIAYRVIEPQENETKTLTYLRDFLQKLEGKKYKRVFCIGGGLLMSICGYIAEALEADLLLVPLTIIAMSDTCVGGKIRINDIQDGHFVKNVYRAFYEPSEVLMDPRFLDSMTEHQIRYGLCKVIKHALYQSDGLLAYLLSEDFQPEQDKRSLLKAILWTVELKNACIRLDPYIMPGGSDLILRAAHHISDEIEEKHGPILSHGEAVLQAMDIDLRDTERHADLVKLYTKFHIPR